jgi:hypothetical protein
MEKFTKQNNPTSKRKLDEIYELKSEASKCYAESFLEKSSARHPVVTVSDHNNWLFGINRPPMWDTEQDCTKSSKDNQVIICGINLDH